MEEKAVVSGGDDGGWTFLETLLVMAILLVLSGGIGFTGLRYLERARIVAARNDMAALTLALESYRIDTGRYPTDTQGLSALWRVPVQPPVPDNWLGPYVDRQGFLDSWGNPYLYREGGDFGYRLTSWGADGKPGGEGQDEDLFSSDER